MKDFVLYPVTYPTMLRISLIAKYVFNVFEDFSIALYFRKYYLHEIFKDLKSHKLQSCYQFEYYNNVILDNS